MCFFALLMVIKLAIICKLLDQFCFKSHPTQSWQRIIAYTRLEPHSKSLAICTANLNHLRALLEVIVVSVVVTVVLWALF